MLRFALPEYRLPKNALEREIDLIEQLGVKFVFNTRIGVDIPLNDLDDRFDAVFISIGTWKGILGLSAGNGTEGCVSGADVPGGNGAWRRDAAGPEGGRHRRWNAAIDSARTALRKGAEVTVFYRRERKDMPAIEEETQAARTRAQNSFFWPRLTA